jgi:N-formylmaleamate deformylase
VSNAHRGEDIRVQANGLSHRVLRYGTQRDQPDLVFVPGITSPARTADFVAVLLADMGFRVHVPDLRGRGETDRAGAGHYRLTDYAADLAGLAEALELDNPVLIGHSLGARIVTAYSALYGGSGAGVAESALVVAVDPPTSGPGRAPYPTTRESFLAQLRQAQAGTTADEVRAFYPKWPERELQIRAEVLASCDETAILETHEGFETEDFFQYWRTLTQPAVLIRGGDSPVVDRAVSRELAEANPGIEIVTVPGAGHMVPWDNLDGFLSAMRPYLQTALQGPTVDQVPSN